MKLLQCFQTHSTCYKGTTRNSKPVGILFHDTAAGNPTIKRYVQPYKGEANYDEMIKLLGKNNYGNDWNHTERLAGLNAWIGQLADGSVATVQSMPWDFQPWGCGSGNKGSCNGWNGMHFVQFEICDDSYKDKAYFEKIYKEACEFAAYICKQYGIDPKGTVSYAGMSIPTIICHSDSYKLGLGSNHGDIYPWFTKFGKNMDTVRNDVYAILHATDEKQTLYRVRQSWADSKSQIGAYASLENAKKACDEAGSGYYVFDESGKAVYPVQQPSTPSTDFKEGDVVKLLSGAKYTSGQSIPSWVFSSTLYVRGFREDGVIISTLKTGAITGVVDGRYLSKSDVSIPTPQPEPEPPKEDPYKTFVKAVQAACGAKVDGIAGPETLSKTVTLSTLWNRKHPAVKAVQTYLIALGYSMPKYGADGTYGAETKAAVKEFQKKYCTTADGVITAKQTTWKKLLKLA